MRGLILSLFVFLGSGSALASDSLSSIRASMTLKVADPDSISDQIIQRNKELNGFFLRRDQQSIQLKVPRGGIDSLMAFCAEQGIQLDKSFSSENHSLELNQSQAKLKAKETLLQKYLELLKESKLESVLQVERAIVQLRNEIETLLGRRRSLFHRIEFAHFDVRFQLHQRPAPNDLVHSPFPWINQLNLSDLNRDFQNADR